MPTELGDGVAALPDALQPIYLDGDVLVLDKPAGLLSVPGRGPDKQDCLIARALQQWPEALVVHRLDMGTSGLLVLARSPAVQRTLSLAFADRRVHKCYTAVVAGMLQQEVSAAAAEGPTWNSIDLPIGVDWPRRPLRVIDHAHGKPSITHWRVLAYDAARDATRVALKPLTGRTHQLRLHCQAIGHPILGDALYADASAQARAPRLLLHAAVLGFAHPRTGVAMRFEQPAPF